MYSPSLLSTSSILFTLILNHYALVTAFPLQSRQTTLNCNDPTAPLSSTCWSTLNITNHLTNPLTGWNATSGQQCPPPPLSSTASCCNYDKAETWSSCYLRQNLIQPHVFTYCDTLNDTTCLNTTDIPNLLPVDPAPAANLQKRYVVTAIARIADLFNAWDATLHASASTNAARNIHGLTIEVDPQGTTSLLAPTVLSSYLLGLPYLGHPNASSYIYPPIPASTNATAVTLLAALQNAPTVSRTIFVNESEIIYPVQSVGAADFLAGEYGAGRLDARLEAGLGLVMGNLTSFVEFAAEGGFVGGNGTEVIGAGGRGVDVLLKSAIASTVRKDGLYEGQVKGLKIGL